MHQPFSSRDAMLAFVIFLVAAGLRAGYLLAVVDNVQDVPPFQVQDPDTSINVIRAEAKNAPKDKWGGLGNETNHDQLVTNLADFNWFGSKAPLADEQEATAHVSPGYVSLVAYTLRWVGDPSTTTQIIIWTQCVLGALTAVIYFFFGRITSGNTLVGALAGLLTALHPFWIVNVAELQDGTLASFLLACALLLGTLAAHQASPAASFFFGGALAGLSLVRAALLPFSFVACIWVLLRCRHQPRGWMCALLVFLGFGNGLAPWTVRNFQVFKTPVPVIDSTFVHLWVGNNRSSTGGPQDDEQLRRALDPDRLKILLAEPNQARRYRMLAEDVWESVATEPATTTIERRFRSGLSFTFGSMWLQTSTLFLKVFDRDDPAARPPVGSMLYNDTRRDDTPDWIKTALPPAMSGMLLFMLFFGLMGWRWSYGHSQASTLASMAMLLIPLPYVLSHAELFSGPRLPLDGVLLTYAAFALTWMLPGERIGRYLGYDEAQE